METDENKQDLPKKELWAQTVSLSCRGNGVFPSSENTNGQREREKGRERNGEKERGKKTERRTEAETKGKKRGGWLGQGGKKS